MVHALVAGANPEGVDVVDGHFGEVVDFDEVGISENIVLIFLFLVEGVENGGDGFGVGEAAGSAELLPDFGVLIELGHG